MAENRELALILKLVADQFQSELKKSGGMLGEFNSFIKDWKTQLAAAGGVLLAIAKSTANYGDELVKASQRMGTTIEDTARLQHAAKLSDTDLQGLSKTVGFLSKEMFAASTGNADAQKTFDRLGISVTTSSGQLKGTTQMLVEMGDKFRLMPEGPEKTALAMLSLGKTGKDVLPLLNSNLREAFQEADRLGLVMSEKDAKAAEHFNDELTKLQGAIRGVTNDIGTALIPKFDAIAHALTTIITDARSAAHALGDLLKLNPAEHPNVGIVQPNEGGRRLRILPAPPGIDKAGGGAPFFKSPAEAAKEQEELGKRLTDSYISWFKVKESLSKQEEVLGKALLEIFLTRNRAADLAFDREAQAQADRLQNMKETAAAQQRLDDSQGKIEEGKGKAQLAYDLALRKSAEDERDERIQNEQAWVTYYDQLGGDADQFYTHKMDLLRAQLEKELDLNRDQAAKLLMAWQNYDSQRAADILAASPKSVAQKESAELNTMNQSIKNKQDAGGDFFEGWAKGMRSYVKTTGTGFDMAADMARRTAGLMEQSFKNFFFDAMEGRIQSFKDALKAMLDFAKQIVSQIGAQLVTRQILGAFAGMSGDGFGGINESEPGGTNFKPAHTGGMFVRRFAVGGPVMGFGNQDSIPAMLTPGEYVLSRGDVSDIKNGLGSRITFVTNNYSNARADQPTVSRGPDGNMVITQTIKSVVKGMVRGGELDPENGERYGMSPKPRGR